MSINLNAIEARHIAWYNDDDSSAEWPDEIDFVVSYEMSGDSSLRSRAMAHEIVREDVPALLAYVRDLEARNQRVRELHPMTCDLAGQNCEAVSDHSMKCTMLVCGPCGESWPCPTVAALTATEDRA